MKINAMRLVFGAVAFGAAFSAFAQLGSLKGPWNGQYYAVYEKWVSWPEAQWLAAQQTVEIGGRRYRGSLAQVTSKKLNDWLWKEVKPANKWIGGWWDGAKWSWAGSTAKWSYTNWAKNGEHWTPRKEAFLAYGPDGKWTRAGLEKKAGFGMVFVPDKAKR